MLPCVPCSSSHAHQQKWACLRHTVHAHPMDELGVDMMWEISHIFQNKVVYVGLDGIVTEIIPSSWEK